MFAGGGGCVHQLVLFNNEDYLKLIKIVYVISHPHPLQLQEELKTTGQTQTLQVPDLTYIFIYFSKFITFY